MHYPWHPAKGSELDVYYREARRGEAVLVCRMADGTNEVIPAWMFDAATCSVMALGSL